MILLINNNLNNNIFYVNSIDTIKENNIIQNINKTLQDELKKSPITSTKNLPKDLYLMIGADYISTKNINVESGLSNGTRLQYPIQYCKKYY